MPSEFETWVKANNFTSGGEQRRQLIECKRAVIADRDKTESSAGSLGQ